MNDLERHMASRAYAAPAVLSRARKAIDRQHHQVERAVGRGSLARPTACDSCRKTPELMKDGRSSIQGHHNDYRSALTVDWLCQPCHKSVHPGG